MSGFGGAGWGGTLAEDEDEARPEVLNFEPPEGTPITRSRAIEFDLTYALPLAALVVSVVYGDSGASEVVYNSTGFTANFKSVGAADTFFLGSERQVGVGVDHFIVRRRGGWPFSPSVFVEGADTSGNAIAQ